MPPERSRPASGDVHLWWIQPSAVGAAELERFRGWMTQDERERGARFVFEHLRRDFAITRGLVRSTLSRYAPVAPAEWRFEANAYGRPHVVAPAAGADLHFNISHTRDFIVCAVAERYGIGVDVEDVTRKTETVAIADRFFSPSEFQELRRLPADRQRERFFHYWTLKESYIKARGMGLSLPLDQFSFHFDASDGPIHISFGEAIRDQPDRWQFALFRPTADHQLAVAVERSGREACSFWFESASAP